MTGAHSGAEGNPEQASGHVGLCLPLLSCGVIPDAGEAVRGVVVADGRRGTTQQARTWSVVARGM